MKKLIIPGIFDLLAIILFTVALITKIMVLLVIGAVCLAIGGIALFVVYKKNASD